MHITVTGVHMQRNPDPALQHPLVNRRALGQDGFKRATGKDVLQRRAHLRLPARAQCVVLQLGEQRLYVVQPAVPLGTHTLHQGNGLGHPVLQQLGSGHIVGIIHLA